MEMSNKVGWLSDKNPTMHVGNISFPAQLPGQELEFWLEWILPEVDVSHGFPDKIQIIRIDESEVKELLRAVIQALPDQAERLFGDALEERASQTSRWEEMRDLHTKKKLREAWELADYAFSGITGIKYPGSILKRINTYCREFNLPRGGNIQEKAESIKIFIERRAGWDPDLEDWK